MDARRWGQGLGTDECVEFCSVLRGLVLRVFGELRKEEDVSGWLVRGDGDRTDLCADGGGGCCED